jgi:hypothetical protein
VVDARQLASRISRLSIAGLELPLLALWAVLAGGLSFITARVTDWNAMTDELVYEHLAISVGQWHSLLPRLHGELVRVLDPLYPILISPWFLYGYVPEDLRNAHIFNAWLMTSACIPAFLLARRVTARRWVAYLVALLSICTPWIIYTTTLLTENAAYPAFLWAFLALHKAVTEPSRRNDGIALLGLALAFAARTEFFVLAAALPLGLVAYNLFAPRRGPVLRHLRSALGETVGRHGVLVIAYAIATAAALGYEASGGSIFFLSVYGSQASPNLVPHGTVSAITGHVADLAFGMGILPFVVGAAWLFANTIKSSAGPAQRAFACTGTATVAVMVVSITSWDLKIGPQVLDRYLFYLVPVVLLGFVCALLDPRRPRWSLLLPALLVSIGFAIHLQPGYLWGEQFPLSTDSPISIFYAPLGHLVGSRSAVSTLLVIATIDLCGVFILLDRRLSWRGLTVGLAVLVLLAFPAATGYALTNLLSTNGHSGRPLTGAQSPGLEWVDRLLGTGARVTEVPYPVSSNFYVSQAFWRDVEFWNKSIHYDIHYPTPDVYDDAVIWFPSNTISFDPATGAASASPTPFVVQSISETRFRISGVVQLMGPGAMVIDADMPWRTDYLTSGLYDDGWTQPGATVHIRVFSVPGQRQPVVRGLDLQVQPPPGVPRRSFVIRSNLGTVRSFVSDTEKGGTAFTSIHVCVPPHGYAEVLFRARGVSGIPGDQRGVGYASVPREGGVLINDLSLSDKLGARCIPRR